MTRGRAKAWCLRIHAEASLSPCISISFSDGAQGEGLVPPYNTRRSVSLSPSLSLVISQGPSRKPAASLYSRCVSLYLCSSLSLSPLASTPHRCALHKDPQLALDPPAAHGAPRHDTRSVGGRPLDVHSVNLIRPQRFPARWALFLCLHGLLDAVETKDVATQCARHVHHVGPGRFARHVIGSRLTYEIRVQSAYDKMRQRVTSKAKHSMDQSRAHNGLIRACDWSMPCFARKTLPHFVIE